MNYLSLIVHSFVVMFLFSSLGSVSSESESAGIGMEMLLSVHICGLPCSHLRNVLL